MGDCEPRNFLQPCLLLLLHEKPDHGYDLAIRLREMHVAEGDPGAVYRALRSLERRGLVRSAWQVSGAGPARRTYRLTERGLVDLDRQVGLLESTHQTLHEFQSRYQRLKEALGDVRSGSDDSGHSGHNGHCRVDPNGFRTALRPGERTEH